MGFFGLDWTILLLIAGAVITSIARSKLNMTYSKYAAVQSRTGVTGAETARRILAANGIFDVTVQPVSGSLTDHYNPKDKTLNLSEGIYGSSSIAAIGVAAHECGHAIQDSTEYAPLRFRTAIVPVVNFGSKLAIPCILAGLLFGAGGLSVLIEVGIILFALTVFFQLVTLPVEYNASSRALTQIETLGLVTPDEKSGAKSVLSAAALTYVASALASILSLLRLSILFGGNRRRR